MKDFVIFTDSACDMDPAILASWGISYAQLHFRFEGEDKEYLNYDMSARDFYANMRAGRVPKTSAVNQMDFEDAWSEIAASGKDILYVAFSSGLSTTYNTGCLAAADVMDEYPDCKIVCVDSLSASIGLGIILKKVAEKKNSGASLDECASYIEEIKMNINHWFTVDDLKYLRKGGRIGAAAAKVASAVGIKPVLNMDEEGHLVFKYICRGRKKAIKALVNEYEKRSNSESKDYAILCHSDCLGDVIRLQDEINAQFGFKPDCVQDVGPVIGSHTGPGVLSVCFFGNRR